MRFNKVDGLRNDKLLGLFVVSGDSGEFPWLEIEFRVNSLQHFINRRVFSKNRVDIEFVKVDKGVVVAEGVPRREVAVFDSDERADLVEDLPLVLNRVLDKKINKKKIFIDI